MILSLHPAAHHATAVLDEQLADARPKRTSSAARRGSRSIAPHTASTSALPVPHVRWKRGTELPSPKLPRSAQLTTGKKRTPSVRSQPPTSSRARVTYCSAQRRGHSSSGAELRDPQPVFERQLLAVGDPRAPLLGRVHHEHPAERLARQAAELPRLAAVQQQHGVPAAQQLQRAHQAREARADDDHVGLARRSVAVGGAHASAMPGATRTSISSGSVRVQRAAQLHAELLRVAHAPRVHAVARRHRHRVQRRQVQARRARNLLHQREELQDRVLVVAQHQERDRHFVRRRRPEALHRVLRRALADHAHHPALRARQLHADRRRHPEAQAAAGREVVAPRPSRRSWLRSAGVADGDSSTTIPSSGNTCASVRTAVDGLIGSDAGIASGAARTGGARGCPLRRGPSA